MKGTLLNLSYGSLKRDLVERVYIPKSPPSPNSEYNRQSPTKLVLSHNLTNDQAANHELETLSHHTCSLSKQKKYTHEEKDEE